MKFITDWVRERKARRFLRKLAVQRVSDFLEQGDVQLTGRQAGGDAETNAVLQTCYHHGWVEPVERTVPEGKPETDGDELPAHAGPVYKLTSAGWNVINYRDGIILTTLMFSFATLNVATITLFLIVLFNVVAK